MDEFTADAFANRDEPVPLLTVTYDDVDTSSSEVDTSPSRRERWRRSLSPSRLREKAQEIHNERRQSSPGEKPSLQDRLFTKLLSQVIPLDELDEPGSGGKNKKVDKRSSEYVTRPSFSIPTMTNNFRRFNARIGIVFVFQSQMIRLFTWRTTTHTLSFLALYTFVCLNPYLLISLPLAIALLFIMIPAFLSRHPPPPQPTVESAARTDPLSAYSYSGPALAPARTIKPAPETSKDFFRNMRDLQNAMADFSNVHDVLVKTIAPATNFSDEVLSSTIFLWLTISTLFLFVSAHLLPYRFIALVGGYALTISGHPDVQLWLVKQQKKAEKRSQTQPAGTRLMSIFGIPVPSNQTINKVSSTFSTVSEITLSVTPQSREVEIFELQHRPILPSTSMSLSSTASNTSIFEWAPHLFTPTPYDPLSPHRISGDRPRGTRFFEDVQPPYGWEWASKKWELDLEAGEWVNDRLIVGVEYDVIARDAVDKDDDDDDDEEEQEIDFDARRARKQSVNADFGGWVWDLPPLPGSNGNRDEQVWLAYGDYEVPKDLLDKNKDKKDKEKKKGHKRGVKSADTTGKDWEESVRFGNKGRTGEWRRRRWVRVVRRVPVDDS